MNKFISLLILFQFYHIILPAQATNQIYGLSGSASSGGFHLSTIDPVTGIVTYVSSAPVCTSVTLLSSTLDPVHGIYYFISGGSIIKGIDLISGNVISSATINSPNIGRLIYNASDNTIYGMVHNLNPPEAYLASVDPVSGSVNMISPTPIAGYISNFGYTIDPVNNIYYFTSNGMFRGIDLSSGTIVSSPSLNGPYSDYFDMFFYNCSDSLIYGILHAVNQVGLSFGVVNPATGSVYQLSSNSFSNGFLNCTYTADPENGVYYYTASGHKLRNIGLSSGNVINDPVMTIPGGGNLVEMEYYTTYCNSLTAVNEIQESKNQLLVYPNPTSGKISIKPPGEDRFNLKITNSLGELVYSEAVLNNTGTFQLDLSFLNPGIYTLHIVNETSKIYNQLIMLNH